MASATINDFNEMKKDAIGEIHNITMGSAATAVSGMLDAKVWITTPQVNIGKVSELSFPNLEPSVHVVIEYIRGVSGSSLLVLKQTDVQLILNQLMGLPLVVTDDFEFDEMNISAVCEVMNQMMGASATALSEILATQIDISTPKAVISEGGGDAWSAYADSPDDYVCTISFDLTIDGIIKSEFVTILSLDLANEMAEKMLSAYGDSAGTPVEEQAPVVEAKKEPEVVASQTVQNSTPQPYANNEVSVQSPPQQASRDANINDVLLKRITEEGLSHEQADNLQLLLGVPLNVSIEIGSARRKVKDILEFSKGTVVELERSAESPVDVIVNGNLIARGEVVVIDDNFAVRITEIIKSKLLDSLGSKG